MVCQAASALSLLADLRASVTKVEPPEARDSTHRTNPVPKDGPEVEADLPGVQTLGSFWKCR